MNTKMKRGRIILAGLIMMSFFSCLKLFAADMIPVVVPPVFSPSGGTYDSDQTVVITSAASDAVIHYTIDGTTPIPTASLIYSDPILVTSDMTIRAIAVFPDRIYSQENKADYVINRTKTVIAPTFSPDGGAFPNGQKISISGTNDAIIHFTTDNTDPTSSSPVYSESIILSAAMTVRAIAIISGYGYSDVVSAVYTIEPSIVSSGGRTSVTAVDAIAAIPTFSPEEGAYPSGQKISLSSSTIGGKIHFTTDGAPVTSSSPVYSEPIVLSTAMTVKALTVAPGFKNSGIASSVYAVKTEEVVKTDPVIASPTGKEDTAITVVKEEPTIPNLSESSPRVDADAPLATKTTPPKEDGATSTETANEPKPDTSSAEDPNNNGTLLTDFESLVSENSENTIDIVAAKIAKWGSEARSFVEEQCSEETDKVACVASLIDQSVKEVVCQDPDTSEAQCNTAVEDVYAEAVVIVKDKYEKISRAIKEEIGKDYTAGDLERFIDQNANTAGTTIPFLSKDIRVKVLRAVTSLALDEEKKMVRGAPIAVTVDTDGDSIPDDTEKRIGTDPGKTDTDGDGYRDDEEILNGFDPLGDGKKITELSDIEKLLIGIGGTDSALEHPITGGKEEDDFAVNKITEGTGGAYRITGTAKPDSVATLYFYSDIPIVTTVTTDEFGNWSYEFDQPLSDGEHEVYVAINDNTGKVVSKSKPLDFLVKEAKAFSPSDMADITDLSNSPSEEATNSMATNIIFFSLMLIAAGVLIFLFIIMKQNKLKQ